jgi:NAD synthase
MRIGFAQINTTVGDIQGNRDRILSAHFKAVALEAELVLTPELALTGYPPQDLVFKSRFISETLEALEQLRGVIPETSITKPPSTELKPDQKDQDTLPPYEKLDEILKMYVEDELSPEDIAARGFEPEIVRWIQRRVDTNEYKRRQAAPGLRATSLAFGTGWRMPIAQRYLR